MTTNAELLKAVAADLQNTGLQTWQQDRILKNDVLQFASSAKSRSSTKRAR